MLTNAYDLCIVICMRTTLNLDPQLLHEVTQVTGVQEKTKLIHMGLRALLQEVARARLAKLYGSERHARAPRRRRAP